MKTRIGVIRFLLAEIEEEMDYNERYKREVKLAEKRLRNDPNAPEWARYWRYLPDCFRGKRPRKSVIKQNAITIRRLLLSFYKEGQL